MSDLVVSVAGGPLHLCPEGAAFDPQSAALLIADAHFGKAASFRAHGVPVPSGTSAADIERLDALIARLAPQRVVFLGDMLHAVEARAALPALTAWRARHARLRVILVEGNHDRHAGPLDAASGFEVVAEPWLLGRFALCHIPQRVPQAYALAGHEHPVFTLRVGRERCRLPCFRLGTHGGVLPAFGGFTGGMEVNDARDALYLCAGERVLAVPDHARR